MSKTTKDNIPIWRCARCGDWITADAPGRLCAYCGKRPEEDTVRVFVYGTLKVGYGNHSIVAGMVRDVTPGTVRDYMLYDGGFPCAWPAEGRLVRGELLTLDHPRQALARLDRLEGTPTHYTRERVEVELDSGERVHAWMYVYAHEPRGDSWWKAFPPERDLAGWSREPWRLDAEVEEIEEIERELGNAPEEMPW